jgi:MFS family permease
MRTLIGASVLWIALSAISDGVTTLVLPVRLGTGADTSEAILGLIGSLGLVVGIVAQPLAGIASDRLRHRIGRVGFAGLGVGLTALALAGLAAASSPPAVTITFAALCLALALMQAPQQALAVDVVPAGQRGRAAGAKGFADLLGSMIGFAVLGPLLASGETGPALATLGGLLLASYAIVVLLVGRSDRQPAASPTGPAHASLRPGSPLLVAVLARFLFLLGIYAVGRFLVPFIAARLDLSVGAAADAAGGLLALLALVTAVGSIPAGVASDRTPVAGLMTAGAVLSMAGIAVIALAPGLALMTVGGVAMAAGTAMFVTANWRLLLDLVAGSTAGRLLGIANIGTAGAAAVAGLAGPLISVADAAAPGAGYPALFGLALVAVGASAAVVMPSLARRGNAHLNVET